VSDFTQTTLGDASIALKVTQYRLTAKLAAPKTGTFQKRLIHIGAHPDCDLCVQDPTVSRQHAKIEVDATGYRLVDLGSKNGTFIGDIRITDIYLTSRMTFRCGSVAIDFELGEDAVEVSISQLDHFGKLLGDSLVMRELFGLLEKIAPTPATVLIEGESGCGKELVADAIHTHSQRHHKPFVVFDCAAVSKDLIESELFGHVRGAFTGAASDRRGAFLQADGGTLFLDEIGELNLDLQPKLLRALESRTVRPVGSEKTYAVDVRVIAATNRSLKQEVEQGSFREDLYYRLAVIKIQMPPLRKRPEDIPRLIEFFLQQTAEAAKRPVAQISFSTLQKLKAYRWPGNVRELRNFIERAALFSDGDRIETHLLHTGLLAQNESRREGEVNDSDAYVQQVLDRQMPFTEAKQVVIDAFEVRYWKRVIDLAEGNVSKAARIAGIHRKSAEYILRKLDLMRDSKDASKL